MKHHRSLILILLIFVAVSGTYSQALFQALNHPVNARGWSMSAAASSQFKDGSGMLYNPAVIAHTPSLWQLNYTAFPVDIYSSTAYTVFSLPGTGKFAALFNYLDYGSFTERDWDGVETGTFTVSDISFHALYGRQISRRLSVGISTNYSQSQLNSLRAKALLGSIGIQYYDEISTLSIGISYHNFGTLLQGYQNDNEDLLSTVRIGISKKLAHLPMIISMDIYRAYPDEFIANIGGEFFWGNQLFLRWGSSTRRFQIRGQENFKNFFASTSGGVGIKVGSYMFDIAISGLADAGYISSLSITQYF
jgi:hypothetical protein